MALKRRSRVSVEFSMASMTDLIFLLLIFFMITSSFVTPNAINLTLPSATGSVVTEPTLVVSIDKDMVFKVNGQVVSRDLLPSTLQSELSNKENKVISLNADKSVPVEYIVEVMKVGSKLKAKVILATERED